MNKHIGASMNKTSWSLFENNQNTLKIMLGLELV